MRRPGIAEPPCSILVPVEDADLPIDGAGCAAVTICIEGHSLNEILVAMLEVEVKGGLLFAGRRRDRGSHSGDESVGWYIRGQLMEDDEGGMSMLWR